MHWFGAMIKRMSNDQAQLFAKCLQNSKKCLFVFKIVRQAFRSDSHSALRHLGSNF